MFSEKNIIVTLGNYGAVVAVYDGEKTKNKILLEKLDDEKKKELEKVFFENKDYPFYLVLDTIDQSYKRKVYPSIRRSDLTVKRDMAQEGEKDAIKNYMILGYSKSLEDKEKGKGGSLQKNVKWECLFVSSSNSELINGWVSFLLEMPNRFIGIYMLPIETFSLYKLLQENIKTQSKIKSKKGDLCCMVVQNRVSGIRQIVFSDRSIVFTRIVNYDFSKSDFLKSYEQDIYSTFEYLKRLFPDISITDIDIVNIFPEEAIKKIEQIKNLELKIINYTPYKAALEVGYAKLLPQNAQFCDLLISRIFSKEKKILKFTVPKILFFEKLFWLAKSSVYLNYLLLMSLCILAVMIIFSTIKNFDIIEAEEKRKSQVVTELAEFKKSVLNQSQLSEEEKEVGLDRMIDFGKIDETLDPIGVNFFEFYVKLIFLRDLRVKLSNFSYTLPEYSKNSPQSYRGYQITFKGDLINDSGDIEDLFRNFDMMAKEVEDKLQKYEVKYAKLPRNLDFNKKYYSFPVDFKIDSRK
jgi:hypothetical protein